MSTELYRLIEDCSIDFEYSNSKLEDDLYFNNVTMNSDDSLCFMENKLNDVRYLNNIFNILCKYCDENTTYLYLIRTNEFSRLVGVFIDKNCEYTINVKLLNQDRDDRNLMEILIRMSKSRSENKTLDILSVLNNYLNLVKENKNSTSIINWICSSLALDGIIVSIMLVVFYFIAGNFITSLESMILYPIGIVYGASILALIIKIILFILSKAFSKRPKEKIFKELAEL